MRVKLAAKEQLVLRKHQMSKKKIGERDIQRMWGWSLGWAEKASGGHLNWGSRQDMDQERMCIWRKKRNGLGLRDREIEMERRRGVGSCSWGEAEKEEEEEK